MRLGGGGMVREESSRRRPWSAMKHRRPQGDVPIDGGAVSEEDPVREGSMVRVLDFDDVEIGEDGEIYLEGRLVLGNVHADEELGVVVVESAA